MCSWGDVAVWVLFAFPGVRGLVGSGAASKSWALKKIFKLFSPPFSPATNGHNLGSSFTAVYEEIYFTSDHAHVITL